MVTWNSTVNGSEPANKRSLFEVPCTETRGYLQFSVEQAGLLAMTEEIIFEYGELLLVSLISVKSGVVSPSKLLIERANLGFLPALTF